MRPYFKLLLLLLITACSKPEETSNTPAYFDLKTYFENEAVRLQKRKPVLTKTVTQNGESEKKDIKIADWKSELGFFTMSDINKPAWRDSYRTIDNANQLTYLAKEDGLKTQKVEIYRNAQGAIKQISILNKTSNLLYTSTENLHYFPDSVYTITKQQKVLLNRTNTYQINSVFKHSVK